MKVISKSYVAKKKDNDSNVDKHKIWLVAGISLAVLIVAVIIFYPTIKEGVAGKAVSTPDPILEYLPGGAENCPQKGFNVETNYLNIDGKQLSSPNAEKGCFIPKEGSVINTDYFKQTTCVKNNQGYSFHSVISSGNLLCLPNDAGGNVGKTYWVKCSAKGLMDVDLFTLINWGNPSYKWGYQDQYFCDGSKWVKCENNINYNGKVYSAPQGKFLCLGDYICSPGTGWVKISTHPNKDTMECKDNLWVTKTPAAPASESGNEVLSEGTGLIAEYKFEGNVLSTAGGAIKTSPGFYGLNYYDSGIGKSVKFGGKTSSYIIMPPELLDQRDKFSISFWIQASASDAGKGIISGVNKNAVSGGKNEFLIFDPSSLTIELAGEKWDTKKNIADGAWHQIVYSTYQNFYLDGQVVDSQAFPKQKLSISQLLLGQEQDVIVLPNTKCPAAQTKRGLFCLDPKQSFAGSLDELKFYDEALSPDEVQDLYATESPKINYLTATSGADVGLPSLPGQPGTIGEIAATTEINCTNGKDDETAKDGLIDCFDPDCSAVASCIKPSGSITISTETDTEALQRCKTSGYDRYSKLTAPSQYKCVFTETDCTNNKDDNNDGRSDCLDSDCYDKSCGTGCLCKLKDSPIGPGKIGAKTEILCADGKDNEGDTLADCKDTDCTQDPACKIKEANCADGGDSDFDGKVDCLDSDCDGQTNAKGNICCVDYDSTPCPLKTKCDDGSYDESYQCLPCLGTQWNYCGAGLVCKDGACQAGVSAETNCADGKDDDLDEKIDCLDADCKTCPSWTNMLLLKEKDNDKMIYATGDAACQTLGLTCQKLQFYVTEWKDQVAKKCSDTILDLTAAYRAVCQVKPGILLGDVNSDTLVDSDDALLILKYEVGLITLTDSQLTAGDVNCDKLTDNDDALSILKKEVGLIAKFPCES